MSNDLDVNITCLAARGFKCVDKEKNRSKFSRKFDNSIWSVHIHTYFKNFIWRSAKVLIRRIFFSFLIGEWIKLTELQELAPVVKTLWNCSNLVTSINKLNQALPFCFTKLAPVVKTMCPGKFSILPTPFSTIIPPIGKAYQDEIR